MSLKVSVIIPTYRREESLRVLLQGLLEQDYRDFEIIVVDQSPPVSQNVNALVANNPDKIKYLSFDGQNAAQARNKGLKEAGGEIIICCDDDVMVNPDFIKNHAKNYADPLVGEVSGRVICANDRPRSKIKKVGRIRKIDGKVTGNFNADFKTEIEHGYGCNISYKKDLLIKVGGYDERLRGTGSFDDMDVSFKIRKLGYRIIFEPLAQTIHLQGAGGTREFSFAQQMYWYYHNFMLFYLKHMPKVFFPFFLSRQALGILRRFAKRGNKEIISLGVRGLIAGFRDYGKKT